MEPTDFGAEVCGHEGSGFSEEEEPRPGYGLCWETTVALAIQTKPEIVIPGAASDALGRPLHPADSNSRGGITDCLISYKRLARSY